MGNFWDWLRRLFAMPAFQWLESWVFSIADATIATFDNLFQLNPPPAFFRSWQADNLPFQPPVTYPLKYHPGQKWPPHSPYDGKGTYTAAFTSIRLPGPYLNSILPPGLALESTLFDAELTYPVVVLFGYQQNLQRANNFTLPGVSYLEFAVGVPNVRRTDPYGLTAAAATIPGRFILVGGPDLQVDTLDTAFFHLTKLYLNRFFPTLLGWVSGLPKVWADVSTTEDTFGVRDRTSGDPIFRASFTKLDKPGKIDDFPNVAEFGKLINTPIVNWLADSLFLYIFLDWGWENAYLQPLTGKLEVFADDIPALPQGTYTFESTLTSPFGSFLVEVPWELVPPFLREDIPKSQRRLEEAERAHAAAGGAG